MKKNIKRFFIFTLIFSFLFGQFFLIQAKTKEASAKNLWELQKDGGINEIGKKAYGAEKSKDIRLIVVNIIKIFLGLLGLIFVILIIFAGFKYMTSMGNQEKTKEALDQIKAAVIGLIIIFCAYSITDYIFDCVLDATSGGTIWMCK